MLGEAWRLGLMPAEDYHRAIDVHAIRGQTLPRGRALAAGELRTLLAVTAADETPAGLRDTALLAVAYAGGLRRAELVALDLTDFDPETGGLAVRQRQGLQVADRLHRR